jgi:hypothetical protein
MRQDMQPRVAPGDEFSIQPDPAIAVIEGHQGHCGIPPLIGSFAGGAAPSGRRSLRIVMPLSYIRPGPGMRWAECGGAEQKRQ